VDDDRAEQDWVVTAGVSWVRTAGRDRGTYCRCCSTLGRPSLARR
jgi:hypothetical protein